jgi:hypothetical protein
MGTVKYNVSKKYIRGEKKGKRMKDVITLSTPDEIHDYLWDTVEQFDKKKCNYIVEWYTPRF